MYYTGPSGFVAVKDATNEALKKAIEDDIIEDPDNTEEIAEKIRNILKNENHTRLLVETDKESTSWKKRAEELMQIAEEVRQKTY